MDSLVVVKVLSPDAIGSPSGGLLVKKIRQLLDMDSEIAVHHS